MLKPDLQYALCFLFFCFLCFLALYLFDFLRVVQSFFMFCVSPEMKLTNFKKDKKHDRHQPNATIYLTDNTPGTSANLTCQLLVSYMGAFEQTLLAL